MSAPDYIEVPVRVPADLEVADLTYGYKQLRRPGENGLTYHGSAVYGWPAELAHQIAGAVEARKPRPPKFQVGDVVEWRDINGQPRAGIVALVLLADDTAPSYIVNGLYELGEANLKLVRRAEK